MSDISYLFSAGTLGFKRNRTTVRLLYVSSDHFSLFHFRTPISLQNTIVHLFEFRCNTQRFLCRSITRLSSHKPPPLSLFNLACRYVLLMKPSCVSFNLVGEMNGSVVKLFRCDAVVKYGGDDTLSAFRFEWWLGF